MQREETRRGLIEQVDEVEQASVSVVCVELDAASSGRSRMRTARLRKGADED